MKVSPTITLAEMVAILRADLSERFACEIENISVEAHGKVKIFIDDADMVGALEFRHTAE
jgi:hypothetical protein